MQTNSQYTVVFTDLGTKTTLAPWQFDNLEASTCLLYGARSNVKNINIPRYTMIMARYTLNNRLQSSERNIDPSLLPPCRFSLRMHDLGPNLQALIWNQGIAKAEYNYYHYDWALQGEKLGYKWTEDEMLPQELVDLILEQDVEQEPRTLDIATTTCKKICLMTMKKRMMIDMNNCYQTINCDLQWLHLDPTYILLVLYTFQCFALWCYHSKCPEGYLKYPDCVC